MRRLLWLLPLIAFVPVSLAADSLRTHVVAQGGIANAAKSSDKTKDAGQPIEKVPGVKAKSGPIVTPEREAVVMAFVQKHHAELAELLVRLKDTNSKEYERAIRDLLRHSERLALLHDRDTDRYEMELKLWQAQSRSDLLTARLKMASSDELRTQLRQILNEQMDLKQSILQLERLRTAEKLQKLDEQLKDFGQTRQDAVERQLRLLAGAVEKSPAKGGEKAATPKSAKSKDKK